jgi:voltage-gated potassium channel
MSQLSEQAPVRLGDRYTGFIERHEIAWELSMGVLALLWVALGFLIDQLGEGLRPDLEMAELGLTVVFVLEFGSRLVAAHDRGQYIRGHLIDALALVPPVRAIRVLRLLRLLRLIRAFAGFYRVAMHMQGIARHRGFAWLVVAWLAVMAITSAVVYSAEHGVNGLFASPFDALWWGISTLTTVGYGDTVPVTPEGRLAAMALMLLGIGLFSAITASITSYFVSQGSGRGRRSATEELRELADLRADGALTDEEFATAKSALLRGGLR